MNTKIVKVENQELVNLIESLQYEVNARKELISFMLSTDMSMDTHAFERYNKEYMDFYIQYNEAKNQLQKMYVYTAVENPISWNLDFETSEITITF